jgi:hypothetical protein
MRRNSSNHVAVRTAGENWLLGEIYSQCNKPSSEDEANERAPRVTAGEDGSEADWAVRGL